MSVIEFSAAKKWDYCSACGGFALTHPPGLCPWTLLGLSSPKLPRPCPHNIYTLATPVVTYCCLHSQPWRATLTHSGLVSRNNVRHRLNRACITSHNPPHHLTSPRPAFTLPASSLLCSPASHRAGVNLLERSTWNKLLSGICRMCAHAQTRAEIRPKHVLPVAVWQK